MLLLTAIGSVHSDSVAYEHEPVELPSVGLDLSPNGTLVDASGILSVPALADALNLTVHWMAPVPTTTQASPQHLRDAITLPSIASNSSEVSLKAMYAAPAAQSLEWLSLSWFLWNDRLYGGDGANLAFVSDPFASLLDVPDQVLKVEYTKGSYKQSGVAGGGGATFYPSPVELGLARRALLNYQVAFDPEFDWVKGGKLPGMWSGKSPSDCSGGKKSTDGTCFSIRLMWRMDGAGEGVFMQGKGDAHQ